MKVAVIDYGLSNLLSVQRAFLRFGAEALVTSRPQELCSAQALVLPGVGAFKDGMDRLDSLGLSDAIRRMVGEGTPLLGICLGMQMLFDEGEEFGPRKGLGIIPGRVCRIPDLDLNGRRQRVPHVGWERVRRRPGCQNAALACLEGFEDGGHCYFVHSYEALTEQQEDVLASCSYGGREICTVAANGAGNALGCQFHPEKSGEAGLGIIDSFLKTAAGGARPPSKENKRTGQTAGPLCSCRRYFVRGSFLKATAVRLGR